MTNLDAFVLSCTLLMPVASSFAQKPADPAATATYAQTKAMQPGGYYGPQPTAESIDLSMYGSATGKSHTATTSSLVTSAATAPTFGSTREFKHCRRRARRAIFSSSIQP
jgi:hypothetical protein